MTKDKVKGAEETIDPEAIFRHAMMFFATDYFLRNKVRNGPNAMDVAVPTMVLSAFAAELMLKALLLLETGKKAPTTHRLDKLYRQLGHKTKRRIEALWEERARPKLKMFNVKHQRPTDLPNALVQCADAFERLRYGYEDPARVLYYIGDFPWILQLYVEEIRPEWFARPAASAADMKDFTPGS